MYPQTRRTRPWLTFVSSSTTRRSATSSRLVRNSIAPATPSSKASMLWSEGGGKYSPFRATCAKVASASPQSQYGSVTRRRCLHARRAQLPRRMLRRSRRGEHPNPKPAETDQQAGEASPANRDRTQPAGLAAAHRRVTLKEAWERSRDAHLIRKGRSEGTIEGYRDHVERLLEIGSTRPCRNWLTIPARSSRGTMRLPRSMVPISPMAPCGRCGLSIIMRAKRTAISRPIIPRA